MFICVLLLMFALPPLIGIAFVRLVRRSVREWALCELLVALVRAIFFGVGLFGAGHGVIPAPLVYGWLQGNFLVWWFYIVSAFVFITSIAVSYLKRRHYLKTTIRRYENAS